MVAALGGDAGEAAGGGDGDAPVIGIPVGVATLDAESDRTGSVDDVEAGIRGVHAVRRGHHDARAELELVGGVRAVVVAIGSHLSEVHIACPLGGLRTRIRIGGGGTGVGTARARILDGASDEAQTEECRDERGLGVDALHLGLLWVVEQGGEILRNQGGPVKGFCEDQ